jgi:hypothetical protein
MPQNAYKHDVDTIVFAILSHASSSTPSPPEITEASPLMTTYTAHRRS